MRGLNTSKLLIQTDTSIYSFKIRIIGDTALKLYVNASLPYLQYIIFFFNRMYQGFNVQRSGLMFSDFNNII